MLKMTIFDYAADLVDFVNENKIHKNNIVKIIHIASGYVLFWWEEDSN